MQILNKIKNFYITIFSWVGKKLKAIVSWNKALVSNIRGDWNSERYFMFMLKAVGYCFLVTFQVLLALFIIASYIACKLTGICIII